VFLWAGYRVALYTIARERNLGIDVELIQTEFAGDEIAKRYFSAGEVNDLYSLAPEERAEGFYNCWTRKEAYLKARGLGLQIPLGSFSLSLRPDRPAEFLAGVEPRWQLAAFRPAERYAAAVVYDGTPTSIRLRAVKL